MVSLPVHLGHTISTYVVLHITYTALLVASSHSITAKLAGPKFGHPGPWNAGTRAGWHVIARSLDLFPLPTCQFSQTHQSQSSTLMIHINVFEKTHTSQVLSVRSLKAPRWQPLGRNEPIRLQAVTGNSVFLGVVQDRKSFC